MLARCLWNVARYAHSYELPAVRALVGEQPMEWAARAWEHAHRRWGSDEACLSETILLLAAAGVDVREADWRARRHMVDIGIRRRGKKWGRPLTAEQQAATSREAIDRILQQVIWPSSADRLGDLDAFETCRPLPSWAPSKSGVFRSGKLGRLVQFDSELELVMLRDFDTDERVVDYREQPVTIRYEVAGEAHEYTPDVIVKLTDGRAFVVEAKPLEFLGDFTNWMKWASLARWCEKRGVGFWIGSPQRSLVEHARMRPDAEKHEFVRDEIDAGAVMDDDYQALQRLVGCQQLGLIASAELLDWRAHQRRLCKPAAFDRQAAAQLRSALLRVEH
jgi:hypothetical protein